MIDKAHKDRITTEEFLDVAEVACLDGGEIAANEGCGQVGRRDFGSLAMATGGGEPSDQELVSRVCLRDKRAFELLYQRYHTPIRRFVYRLNRRFDSVEEIVNDVMLVVWQKAESFNGTSKVSTWILGIAYNKALNTWNQRPRGVDVDFDEVEPFLPGVVDQGMREYELQDWLSVALDRLSVEQRAVMELTCLHGMHYEEIAQVLGCSENTVKTRMFYARQKLKQLMPEIGGATGTSSRSIGRE